MSQRPSYEDLVTLVAAQACVIDELKAKVAELERRLAQDSSNSSQPPSKDSIEAKARRRKDLSDRKRSSARKPGAQPGHTAHRLAPAEDPDDTRTLSAPDSCSGCGAELTSSQDIAPRWAQVWDTLPVVLHKQAYVLPRRRCTCGCVSGAAVPHGVTPGAVSYGPNLNAAAVLLTSQGNVPPEGVVNLSGVGSGDGASWRDGASGRPCLRPLRACRRCR